MAVKNNIQAFIHCGQCLDSKPDDVSPRAWSRNEVGHTPVGIQIWCMRHAINVADIDFEGQVHPAVTTT